MMQFSLRVIGVHLWYLRFVGFDFTDKVFNYFINICFQDATWVAPTKTLKCKTLEEVYLLLKSSDRIAKDLSNVKNYTNNENSLTPCLILKKWRDINPCTEFRCFVVNNELTGNKFFVVTLL